MLVLLTTSTPKRPHISNIGLFWACMHFVKGSRSSFSVRFCILLAAGWFGTTEAYKGCEMDTCQVKVGLDLVNLVSTLDQM